MATVTAIHVQVKVTHDPWEESQLTEGRMSSRGHINPLHSSTCCENHFRDNVHKLAFHIIKLHNNTILQILKPSLLMVTSCPKIPQKISYNGTTS